MHVYLPAIGFGKIKKKSQLQRLIKSVQSFPDQVRRSNIDEESNLAVYTKEVAPGAGILLCGEEDRCGGDGNFQMEYYIPYVVSDVCSSKAECSIERESGRECYNGICDDARLGLNLIFTVNNFMDYYKYKSVHGYYPNVSGICLSGLSVNGEVLLPVAKRPEMSRAAIRKEEGRLKMVEAAREGDQEAIENLTIDEVNLNSKINRLLSRCDIYTLVESSIMPSGMESSQYTILGEITKVETVMNSISRELLYKMDVVCNGIFIRVLINHDDLLGEPKVGRRFKGEIWLQCFANFI